jgi:hypothetical protein
MPITVPATQDVQFAPAAGKFDLDMFVDPSGAPVAVLDSDVGFSLSGRIELPGWLSGVGHVRLFGQEVGGPFNGRLADQTVNITGASSPADPPTITYPWNLNVPGGVLPDPSPGSGVYQLVLTFTFTTPATGHTDIAAVFDLGSYLAV